MQELKSDLGSRDIESMIGYESEKFDRRKFGKFKCGFCRKEFNPFYTNTIKEGDWVWAWASPDHKEPQCKCAVDCPNCKNNLRFKMYIGQ